MKSRLLGFLLSVCSLFLSSKSVAQATCIAVIDSTRTEFCVGSGAVTFVNARAVGENIEWISLGDGIFDDPFAVNPTYTPGSTDRSRGFAYILLDVYKDDTIDFCSQLPWVKLNLGSMAATATPATQGICTGASITNIVLSSGLSGATYSWTRDNTSSVTGIAASGTGNISGALTNNTGAPVTVTFTISASNASCAATPVTATVVVSPRPNAVASASSQSICSGSNITPITASGNFPGTVFNWSRNNTTSVNGISSSGSGNITGVLTKRSGSTTTTVTFTITPNLNGCTGTSVTSTVAVSPSTVAVSGSPATQTVCSGSAITTIVPSGGSGSTTYSWSRNNTTIVTGIAASGSGSISGTLNNTTSASAYVTFTITRSGSTCTNRATVLVNPVPVASVSTSSQSVCSGAAIAAVNISSNIVGTVFNWTRNNAALVTGIGTSGSGNITGALVNTTSSPVTVTFTITPVFNGCSGTPVISSVLVSPNPSAAIVSPLVQSVCSGSSIAPIIGNGAGIVFNWTRNNTTAVTGIPASGTGNIEGSLINTGTSAEQVTFTITPSANGCVGSPVMATATVNPGPTAVISGSQTVCAAAAAPELSIAFTGTGPWNVAYTNGSTVVPVSTNSNPYLFTVPAAAGTYTLVNMSDANCAAQQAGMSGSAVITQLSYAITAAAGINGFITPAGITNVNCGNDQTYFITANTGFTVSDVLVDGSSIGAVSSYTFTNVNASHTISAIFVANAFTINANAGSNGSISPAGEATVSAGSNHTYNIVADACYRIADVLVDGISVGAVPAYTFTDISASHSISASFTQLNYSITATAAANGTISSPGVTSVNCGGSQTYNFIADACYQIADVLVDGVSVGAVASYTFENVTAAHTISVSFTQLNYSITATAAANGTISSPGVTSVNCGGSQTYNFIADACYQIADVLVDGVSVGAVASYTFENVTAAHTISVSFIQLNYSITATAAANGAISPAGLAVVNCGSTQTYIITADEGYNIADVLVDGVSAGAVSSYTFNSVSANHSIQAVFGAGLHKITATAGANGAITPSGSISAATGSSHTYDITANTCYQVEDVLVDGISVGAISSYTFSNINAAHTISATFTQLSYTINASAGANGNISNAG
ncbi:MAG TPA: hypothetical protein PLY34_17525, partial [Ferruginibacter sp.]|nr:hypothetical protein [Ferruginibacter sp.]